MEKSVLKSNFKDQTKWGRVYKGMSDRTSEMDEKQGRYSGLWLQAHLRKQA